jgi:hypothetical protein
MRPMFDSFIYCAGLLSSTLEFSAGHIIDQIIRIARVRKMFTLYLVLLSASGSRLVNIPVALNDTTHFRVCQLVKT